jgi:3-methyladenine DNA glycosylase AlkD
MTDILENIRKELREASDEKTRQSGLRYLPGRVRLYGIKTKTVSDIARTELGSDKESLGKEDIVAMCDSLWQSGMMEESFIACSWSEKLGPG